MEYLSIVPATALGYLTFKATTHPDANFRKKLPNIKIKRFQLFPIIRIHAFGRVIHLHHWFNFSILLALSSVTSFAILDHIFTRGLLLGGIIQGLTLPERRLIYKSFTKNPAADLN